MRLELSNQPLFRQWNPIEINIYKPREAMGRCIKSVFYNQKRPQQGQGDYSWDNKTVLFGAATIDLDVIARLCTALGCKVGDLLEFIPAEEQNLYQ